VSPTGSPPILENSRCAAVVGRAGELRMPRFGDALEAR
jgi:hypothetical protein